MKAKLYMLLTTLTVLASGRLFAEGDTPPPADQSFWQTLVMIGIAFLFFYVILWRPEQKRRKALEEQRNTLKKGDRVVAMGIIGTVVRVGDQTVILKMYDGAKLEFFKAAITDLLPEEDSGKKVELIAEDQ
ncbi:preprotein translocase subunit YajC [Candidatus Protochlamydia phocaeensis]|uniref:preprotein translocase subunit YajC n=1 Tax=Candidatus Protochlamydia phocaeensis TaxID=1414722 RepID=UPI0008396570|nr:preprotein translocase subunit YajC [Candidatus Protochlamydia phocaeensis]